MDGKVTISTALDNSGFQSGVKNISGSLGGLKSVLTKIGGLVTAAFAVRKLVQFGAACVELGSDVVEVQNVVDTAFGGMAYKMEAFADTAITNFGMSQLAAKKTGSTYMAMAKGMGMADEAASDMAIALTGLTGDVASFYNISQEEADTKLKSIFTGETETLKSLGVVMTQTNLDAYALANGFGKTTSAMNQVELVALRYAYATNALSLASGDFLKTQDSWANQTRILSMQWQQFMSVIGQALTTVLLPAVKVLNTIVAAMINASNAFNSAITAIFGGANKQIQTTAASADGVTSAISDSVDQQDALTDATKKTAKAQNKLGIDELNVISQNSGSAASTSAGSSAGSGISEAVTEEQDALSDKMQKFVAKITAMLSPLQAIDFTPLQASFERLGDAISPLVKTAFAGLEWVYYNLFVPLAAWTITDALPAFVDVLSGGLQVLSSVIDAVAPLAQWLWNNLLLPIAAWTGGVVVLVLEGLADALISISDWIEKNQPIMQGMTGVVATFMLVWKGAEIAAFVINAGGLVGMLGKITTAVKAGTVAKLADKVVDLQLIALYAKDFVVSLATGAKSLISNTAAWLAATAAKVADTAAQWAHIAATTAYSTVCTTATIITKAFGAAVAFLTSPIGLVVLAIGALIAIIVLLVRNWDTVKATAAAVWDGVRSIWSGAANWFMGKVLDPLVGGFKGAVNLIIGFVNGLISAVTGGINVVIDALNSLRVDIPKWVPKYGGSTFGLNLPRLSAYQIPKLAQGAVIPPNREFLAVLGDQSNGTNIEAPLDTIKQALAEVLAQSSAGQEITLYITTELDGEAVYRNQQKIKAGKGYPVGMNPAFD